MARVQTGSEMQALLGCWTAFPEPKMVFPRKLFSLVIEVEHVGCEILVRALWLLLPSDVIQVARRSLHQLSPLLLLSLCASLGWEALRGRLRSPCRLRRSIR